MGFETVAEGLVRNKAVHLQRMYFNLIQRVINPEASCLAALMASLSAGNFFLTRAALHCRLNEKTVHGNWLQLNIWNDQAQPCLGVRLVETINTFHTFSVAEAYPSMQRISFDVSIKTRLGFLPKKKISQALFYGYNLYFPLF